MEGEKEDKMDRDEDDRKEGRKLRKDEWMDGQIEGWIEGSHTYESRKIFKLRRKIKKV